MKPLRITAVASIISLCLSCAGGLSQADRKAVKAAVAHRVDAVMSGDKALFMSLLAPGDGQFTLEQSRWFDYRLSAEIRDYKLEVESLEPAGKDRCVVAVHLSYRIGTGRDARELRYEENYAKVEGAWLDADIAFTTLEVDHFIIRFDPSVDRLGAWKISGQAEHAWKSVREAYGATPSGKTVLKLFGDRELLRQNSKITVARPFSGWGEPGESIKMWVRPDPAYAYAPIIAHELVHKVTLEESQNLCSWFAEGAANYFGTFPELGGSYLANGFHGVTDYDRSLAWLASVDPDRVADDAEWRIYGGMSGLVLEFIEENYGKGKPQEIVHALSKHPQERSGYVYALHDAAYRSYLAAAVVIVLGVGMDELDKSWRTWIRGRKG